MNDRSSSSLPLPPSASGWRMADLYHFYNDFLGTIRHMHRRHGRVFRWKALREVTVLLGAEANQWSLLTQQKSLSAAQAWQEHIGTLFHGGLMLRDGSDHRHHRKLLMPAFRQEALHDYLCRSESIIDQHIASWSTMCPDIYRKVKELTLEIAIQSFFGINRPDELKIYNQLISEVVAGSIAFNRLPLLGGTYQRALRARKSLVSLLAPLVVQRRNQPQSDMISQLCQSLDENGQGMSNPEIVDQLIFIMMAAHDTTASTLSSLFYELALHQNWQSSLREEAQAAASLPMGQRPDQLPLALMVIRETLRLHTPLKVVPRVTTSDLEFQGFALPKGTRVSVFPSFTHRMDDYWTDPESFDPLRFNEVRQEHKTHSFAYAPFGGGMHSCLGQFFAEKFLSVILGKITMSCTWQIPEVQKVKFRQVPIQVPKHNLPVEISRLH